MRVNVDNFDELRRISRIVKETQDLGVGLRVNPQIGAGSVKSMSVAGEYSKFGIPISSSNRQIIEAFVKYPWLDGLHVHTGSQGLGLKKLVSGIKVVHKLAQKINEELKHQDLGKRLRFIDIGGGFPISYRRGETQLKMKDYVSLIKKECPGIFKDFEVINEFGRYNHARTGWVASKVEYVKHQGNNHTAIIHVGADLFLREAYNPKDWHHQISVLNSDFKIKEDEWSKLKEKSKKNVWHIAGPMCFGGDFIRKNVKLGDIKPQDIVLIHETGANALNLWSRHCSRQIPLVLGYENNGKGGFKVLKKKESVADIIRFWSP